MLVESRGNNGIRADKYNFCDAILNPQASFDGLLTLESIPSLDIKEISNLSYSELCKYVFNLLFKIDFLDSRFDLDSLLNDALKTYEKFDNKDMPLDYELINNNLYMQKLFLGPTRAFKDIAMQPFCSMLCNLISKDTKRYLIISATSGDTGPATLEAIKNKENIYAICIYPYEATSDVQRLQMTTIKANNIKVIAIKGNFDDAQSALKVIINDNYFKQYLDSRNFKLSVSNSINFGRIFFQIIYHMHSYLYLLKNNFINKGEFINIIVPSGNFGNALGAFFAKKMGININKIIIATNENDVLYDFIKTGVYNLNNRKLIHTNTPAMDILKSSNVERVLYHLFGMKETKIFMDNLNKNKCYSLSLAQKDILQTYFDASRVSSKEISGIIKLYASRGFILDPHTASGIKAFVDKNIKTILCATAEWSKFAPTILSSINDNIDFSKNITDINALQSISKTYNLPISKFISNLFSKKECDYEILDINEIKDSIIKWIDSL